MGRYLDRLRADFSKKCPPPSLTELTKAPSVGFVSTPPGRFPENTPAANDTPAACWLLHFTDREAVTVWITPPATHGEVLTLYPESVAAEPAPPCDEPPSAAVTDDDRRTCHQCANLTTNLSGEARCLAAWRGELKDAARHYHPVADMLHRCGAFRPKGFTA